MGYKAKQIILNGTISNCQQTFKELLNILNHQENIN